MTKNGSSGDEEREKERLHLKSVITLFACRGRSPLAHMVALLTADMADDDKGNFMRESLAMFAQAEEDDDDDDDDDDDNDDDD